MIWRVCEVLGENVIGIRDVGMHRHILNRIDLRLINVEVGSEEGEGIQILLGFECLLRILKLDQRILPVLEEHLDFHDIAEESKKLEHLLNEELIVLHQRKVAHDHYLLEGDITVMRLVVLLIFLFRVHLVIVMDVVGVRED